MKDKRFNFFMKCVNKIITDKNASILVCGGGKGEKTVFQSLGFTNVTISNIDDRINENEYEPYKWKYSNAEDLPFENSSFDYTVIKAAIHHASSPHKVLTELYRVSKIGVLASEARDSITMRFLEKFNLTQTYECSSVYCNNCKYGGVNNTEIPNFIYRWKEREIEKTIQSYAPYYQHKYVYMYGTDFPSTANYEKRNRIKLLFLNMTKIPYYIFSFIFRKQRNMFIFYIEKQNIQEKLFPWLIYDIDTNEIKFNKNWGDKKYK